MTFSNTFMAATIRLTRIGKKKQPFYRIVVCERASKQNGAFIETIGTYNPLTSPATVVVKKDRYVYWTSVGAILSDGVAKLKIA